MNNTIYNGGWENRLSKAIRKRRLGMGLSQNALANELNVSQQTVSGWEAGKSIPDMPMLITLCNFFKCEVDSLLGRIDDYKTHDNKWICEKTGLSENALIHLQDTYPILQPINDILESNYALRLFSSIRKFFNTFENPHNALSIIHDDGCITEVFDAEKISFRGFAVDVELARQAAIFNLQKSLEDIASGLDRRYYVTIKNGETIETKEISAKAYFSQDVPDVPFCTSKAPDDIFFSES